MCALLAVLQNIFHVYKILSEFLLNGILNNFSSSISTVSSLQNLRACIEFVFVKNIIKKRNFTLTYVYWLH